MTTLEALTRGVDYVQQKVDEINLDAVFSVRQLQGMVDICCHIVGCLTIAKKELFSCSNLLFKEFNFKKSSFRDGSRFFCDTNDLNFCIPIKMWQTFSMNKSLNFVRIYVLMSVKIIF